MPFATLAGLAALLVAPTAPSRDALEDLARERASAFAEALEAGAALPHASPKIVFETYLRPRYSWTRSDPAELRGALAGCRRGEAFVHVYEPRSQYVALRYLCPPDREPNRWPVLEQDIDNGQITKAWVATGPRPLERAKINESRAAQDSSFAADRAAALALISALLAGGTRLPRARPGLELHYRDHVANTRTVPAAAAVLSRSLAGCRPGDYDAEPRRWLGSRLAIVPFSCPATHRPHPEMAIMLELLDGRVQSLRLEAGPPPPPIIVSPAPL
jgi:hypothetical protein